MPPLPPFQKPSSKRNGVSSERNYLCCTYVGGPPKITIFEPKGGPSFLGARESLVGIIRSDILRPFVVRILGTRQGEDDPCQKRHFEFSHCVTRRSIFIPRLLGCGWCIISGQAKWNFAAR